jgi:protease I
MAKKVLFVVAHEGYQQIEYGEPKKLLETAGIKVITASNAPGFAIAKDGSTTAVDVLIKNVNVADYDGIFFIGGPGALEHLDNQDSYILIKAIAGTKKPLGAICISTRILAKAGVLTQRKATGWDGDHKLAELFKEYDVEYVKQGVVIDGHIITAVGPHAALEFGKAIINLLK